MRRQGYLFVCDRCGVESFSEGEHLANWKPVRMDNTKLLCPDCYDEFVMIEQRHKEESRKFFNSKGDRK